jgi:hypothetical protein
MSTSSDSGFLSSIKSYTPRQWTVLLFALAFLGLSITAMTSLYSSKINLDAARNALNGMTAMGTLAIGFGLGRHITDDKWLKNMEKDDFVLFLGGMTVISGSISASAALNQSNPKIEVAKQSIKWTSIVAGVIVVVAMALKRFDSWKASAAEAAKAFYMDEEEELEY